MLFIVGNYVTTVRCYHISVDIVIIFSRFIHDNSIEIKRKVPTY